MAITKDSENLYSSMRFVGDGVTKRVPLTFDLREGDGLAVDFGEGLVTSGYLIDYDVTPVVVLFSEPLPLGKTITIRRLTKIDTVKHVFQYTGNAQGGADFSAKNVDENFEQITRASQDAMDSQVLASQSLEEMAGIRDDSLGARDRAVLAETNAKQSELNSKDSELKSKASENSSKISETNSKQSELNAKASELEAKDSETNAHDYEVSAKDSASKAKVSETNSAKSETNARSSELKSKASETNAKASETKAKDSEVNAKDSETKAKDSESNSKDSEVLSKKWATNPVDVPVVNGEYSAYHWASKAGDISKGITPEVQEALNKKWDIQPTVGTGSVMREGAYGLASSKGEMVVDADSLKNAIKKSGVYRIYYNSGTFNYGSALNLIYNESFTTMLGVKSVINSVPDFIADHYTNGTLASTSIFYTDKNTRTDANGVLHAGTATPIDTLNVSDMVSMIVDRDDVIPNSGAIYRALGGNTERITPELYGAKGDGIVDDTTALTTALLNGKKVYLREGATYRITKDITIEKEGKLEIIGSNAKIYWDFNDLTSNAVSIKGIKLKTTELSNKKYINTNKWFIADTSNVQAGMLMEVISSKSWYTDPRPESTDARISELHRVVKVEVGVVYTETPSNSSYLLLDDGETTEVTFYKPLELHVKDVGFEVSKRPVSDSPKASKCFNIWYTVDSTVEGCKFINGANAGLTVYHSYKTTVSGNVCRGSNDYFTGYGIQTIGTMLAVIKNNFMSGCRRGVDVSGAKVISLNSDVSFNTVVSSGTNSRGQVYGWDEWKPGAYCSGVGTHGASDKTLFKGNSFTNLHTAVVVRSPNVSVVSNSFVGRFLDGVNCSFAWNVNILNNFNMDIYTLKEGLNPPEGVANSNSQYILNFVKFQETWRYNICSVIKGNRVRFHGDFVVIDSNVINMELSDNTLEYAPLSVATTGYVLKTLSAPSVWYLAFKDNVNISVNSTLVSFNGLYNDAMRKSDVTYSGLPASINILEQFNCKDSKVVSSSYYVKNSRVYLSVSVITTIADSTQQFVRVGLSNLPHVSASNILLKDVRGSVHQQVGGGGTCTFNGTTLRAPSIINAGTENETTVNLSIDVSYPLNY